MEDCGGREKEALIRLLNGGVLDGVSARVIFNENTKIKKAELCAERCWIFRGASKKKHADRSDLCRIKLGHFHTTCFLITFRDMRTVNDFVSAAIGTVEQSCNDWKK